MSNSISASAERICVHDDDPQEVKYRCLQLKEHGFDPFPLDVPFGAVQDLMDMVTSKADCLLIDHDLKSNGFASFYGSDVVASLYDVKFPAILYSSYYHMDSDLEVRQVRRKVPLFINKQEARPTAIVKGLERIRKEFEGKVLPDRVGRRTLIRVSRITDEARQKVLDVKISSWYPDTAVRIPLKMIPEEIQANIHIGTGLIALVNTAANRAEDLFFDDFELAPPPIEF